MLGILDQLQLSSNVSYLIAGDGVELANCFVVLQVKWQGSLPEMSGRRAQRKKISAAGFDRPIRAPTGHKKCTKCVHQEPAPVIVPEDSEWYRFVVGGFGLFSEFTT
jgi:hypothetical protein